MDIQTLQERNYVPYSGTPSVCVVRSMENNYFPGVRIENTSFPLTISALQNAIFCCLSEGEMPKAVYLDEEHRNNLPYWKSEFKFWVYTLEELKEDYSLKSITLSPDKDSLTQHLERLFDYAHTPHSDFPVSALLETDKGYVSGVNIECEEWNYGLCAERVAIAKAISYGLHKFNSLHIHSRDGEFSSPCGACRQVIIEHMSEKPVHLHHADKTVSTHFSDDLLPYGFHSSKLGHN